MASFEVCPLVLILAKVGYLHYLAHESFLYPLVDCISDSHTVHTEDLQRSQQVNWVSVYDSQGTSYRQILGLFLHSGLYPKIGNVPSQTDPAGRGARRQAADISHCQGQCRAWWLLQHRWAAPRPPGGFLGLIFMQMFMQMKDNWVACDD